MKNKNSWLRILIVFTIIFMFSGCGIIKIDAEGYANKSLPPIGPGASFWVVKDEKAKNQILEDEIFAKITKALVGRGFTIADHTSADYVLGYVYGIGHAGKDIDSWVDQYGRTFVYSSDSFSRWLSIRLVDAKIARTGKTVVVWEGRTGSTGSSSDFRRIVNYLIIATIDRLGQDTSQGNRRVIMTLPDERAEKLN